MTSAPDGWLSWWVHGHVGNAKYWRVIAETSPPALSPAEPEREKRHVNTGMFAPLHLNWGGVADRRSAGWGLYAQTPVKSLVDLSLGWVLAESVSRGNTVRMGDAVQLV